MKYSITARAKVFLGFGDGDDFDCPIIESDKTKIGEAYDLDQFCVLLKRVRSKFELDSFDINEIILESPTATVYLYLNKEGGMFDQKEVMAIKKALHTKV